LRAPSPDHEEILSVLSGAVTLTIADETGSLFVPAGALHAFEAKDDFDAIAVPPAGHKTFGPDAAEMPSYQPGGRTRRPSAPTAFAEIRRQTGHLCRESRPGFVRPGAPAGGEPSDGLVCPLSAAPRCRR
jgi:hypothetical protein